MASSGQSSLLGWAWMGSPPTDQAHNARFFSKRRKMEHKQIAYKELGISSRT
jgi:hypothetical protein